MEEAAEAAPQRPLSPRRELGGDPTPQNNKRAADSVGSALVVKR